MVITVNTIIGIKQEGSAEKAKEALINMCEPNVSVICDGVKGMIPATGAVPRNLIIISFVDCIPDGLQVDESMHPSYSEQLIIILFYYRMGTRRVG